MSDELIELPEGWELTTLGKLGEWSSGGTPSRKNPKYYGGDILWIKTGDLPDGVIESIEETITSEGLANSSAKVFPGGSLVVAMYGATIGKLGILKEAAASNQACAVLKSEGITAELISYLFYYLLKSREELRRIGQGGAQPNISQSILKDYPIFLPPINEQRRIVATIEKLRERSQKARSALADIPQLCDRFRQSILASAFRGDLTADWRNQNSNVEPAEVLLEKVKEERFAKSKTDKQRKELEETYSYKEEHESAQLPDTWQYTTLEKLCYSFQYGTSAKSLPTGKIPVLRMGNLQRGEIDWRDLAYTNDDEEISKYSLKSGDVLFNRTNSPELVGKTSIYRGEQPAIFAGYLIKIDNSAQLNSEYLNYCLNTNYAKNYCWQVKTDGVSQSNINAQKLAKFELPLCSLEEQHEIVRQIQQLFKVISQIERQYRGTENYLIQLDRAILAKAFRGELVEQNPNDEPASVLLERIRAEREQQANSNRHKRSGAK